MKVMVLVENDALFLSTKNLEPLLPKNNGMRSNKWTEDSPPHKRLANFLPEDSLMHILRHQALLILSIHEDIPKSLVIMYCPQ